MSVLTERPLSPLPPWRRKISDDETLVYVQRIKEQKIKVDILRN